MTLKTICSPGNSLCSGPFQRLKHLQRTEKQVTAAESPGRGGVESFPVSSPGNSAWPQLPMADPVCPLNHGEKLRPPVVECLFRSIFWFEKLPPPIWEVVDASTYLRSVQLKNFYSVGVHFFHGKKGSTHPSTCPSWKWRNPSPVPRKTLQSSNFEGSHNFPPNSKSPQTETTVVSWVLRSEWNFRSLKNTPEIIHRYQNGPYFKLESPFPRPIMLKSVNSGM